MANPRRAQLRQQIAALQAEVVFKEADLGRTLTNPRPGASPSRRPVRREIARLEAQLARLDQRLAHTPAKVPVATLTPAATRATMNTDRRNLANAIKIATSNAERWLARRFFGRRLDGPSRSGRERVRTRQRGNRWLVRSFTAEPNCGEPRN